MKLKNRQALVTGGSEGLGLSITKKLLAKGAKVAICGRSLDKLKKVKKEIKSKNLSIYQCDVADYQAVEKMVKKIGRIDVLVNNAGVWLYGNLEDHEIESINQVIDTNLKGVIYVTKAALAGMKKRNEGYIVNISSTSGLGGKLGQSVYVASKFGVRGLTESLKLDLAETKVKVVGFFPGGMKTKIFEKANDKKDVSKWMETDKVAEIVVFILERDETLLIDQLVVKKRIL